MVVNDNAGPLTPRGVLKLIASKARSYQVHPLSVGASLLAMVVNDNAGNLMPRSVL